MGYLNDLPQSVDKTWVDGIINKSDETVVYITICGPWQAELLEALDCLYLDDKRSFELIQMKKDHRYIGVCVAMKHKPVEKEETVK